MLFVTVSFLQNASVEFEKAVGTFNNVTKMENMSR